MSNFDPGKHLVQLKGKDYLEVKWRLLWLRTDHPNADIETVLIERTDTFALFRARVSIPDRGSATGYGSETKSDFGDFIEKAETKAIGRALGALGFGTQFTDDFEGQASANRPVDAPVQRQPSRGNAPQTREVAPGHDERPKITNPTAPASDKQIGFIKGLARQKGISEDKLEARCSQLYTRPLMALTKADASDLIERLNNVPDPASEPPQLDVVEHDNTDTQAMIADFDSRHPADSAKFRQ
jgi:hypothetical protein